MNNPLHILQTLDRHLTRPTEITVFGRAALVLGFSECPKAFAATQDVDAILPLSWLEAAGENLDFWEAQQKTNDELEPSGLYITHLFREMEIILTPEWQSRRISIRVGLARLTVYRPCAVDLILSKMARGDANDLRDIEFLLQYETTSAEQLQEAFKRARVPDVSEIQKLFLEAQPKVLSLAKLDLT